MATSELERARALLPGAPDAMLIEGLIEALARRLDLKPPTNLHLAASFQNIKDIRSAAIDWAGMLTPSEDGAFVITVRSADPLIAGTSPSVTRSHTPFCLATP